MNCIYRSIWNHKTGTFTAVSENAKSAGKKSCTGASVGSSGTGFLVALKALALSMLVAFGATAYAQPLGGVVKAGSASISTAAGSTIIQQATPNVVINWQSFNVGVAEAVQFVQPNSASVALNRVTGSDPSAILGKLSANGKVFLVNPNGVLFGINASVNVGALAASTLDITDGDFLAGHYAFSGNGNGNGKGAVLNQGAITARDGGYVALLGANVGNDGVISAKLGSVALAAGKAITLDVAGDGLLNVAVNQGAVHALVQNGGLIQADGGQVLLSAQAAGNLLQSAVNNTGVIRAQSIENHNGTIRLLGDVQSGTVLAGGTLDVSGNAPGQTGGNVTLTAHHVGLFGAHIDASGDAGGGTVLAGGDLHGTNPAVPNAAASYLSSDASINADAKTSGNGGKVVLWGNDSTRAYGSISALGGAQGGDGGLIETSGHQLDVAGIRVNASAPAGQAGKAGTWLLDPADVIIGAGTVGATLSGGVFAPDAGVNAATIDAGALQGILNGGTDVTITTTNNGAPGIASGDITVNSALVWTTAKTLTLNAAHDIDVNFAITATASTALGSGIVLNAQNDVRVNAPLTASSDNSAIRITAGHDVTANFGITASAINTVINLTGGRDVTSSAAITASGLGAAIAVNAGRDAAINTVTANGGGAATVLANRDVIVSGTLTADTAAVPGSSPVILIADNDGTGPGLAGGTVSFLALGQVVTPKTTIRFNPATYTNTQAEIDGYQTKVSAVLDGRAWVFAQANNKVYDATTAATLAFRGTPTDGGIVTLVPGTATFDTKNVGNGKTVTFNGYTLAGGNVARFDLFAPFGSAAGAGTTTANITPRGLTVTASGTNKVYDGITTDAVTLADNRIGGDSLTLANGAANFVDPNVGNGKTVNVTGISVTGTDAGNYSANSSAVTAANITPAPLTVTAADLTKVYGQTATPSGFTPTGLVNGETIGSVTETSSGTVPTAAVPGPYPIIPSAATGGTFAPSNYAITYANGALTVTPAGLIVTASNVAKAYGETPTLSGFTAAGLVNGDTIASVTETSPGRAATAAVAGSPYAITPSSAVGGTFVPANYSVTYVNGVLTIVPARLTVTADNASKPYGQTITLSGFTTAGLLNGDTVGSVTEVSPGTVATASVAGSPYPITPSNATGGTFVPSNYVIAYVNGALTITPIPLVVTASNVAKVYGAAPTLSAFTTAGLVNGDTVGSVTETSAGMPATAPVAGSPYPIIPSSATGGTFVPSNYTTSYVNGVLTVTPAPLGVTAGDATKVFGTTPVLTTFTTTGLVNGDTVGSVTETSPGIVATAPVAGSPYPITPSGATGGTFVDTNYTITYNPGVLTVTPLPVPPVVPVETFGVVPDTTPPPTLVVPPVIPPVVLTDTPPGLTTLVPPATPVSTPPDLPTLAPPVTPATPVSTPPTVPVPVSPPVTAVPPVSAGTPAPPLTPAKRYVAPQHPRKQDRN